MPEPHTQELSEPDVGHLVLRLWREHVREHLGRLILAMVLMAVAGGTLGLAAYMIQPLFDLVLTSGNQGGVMWVALTIAGVFVLRAVTGYSYRVLIVSVGQCTSQMPHPMHRSKMISARVSSSLNLIA